MDYRTKRNVLLDESEWVTYPDPSIPAIVSEELWNRANALYKRRREEMKSHSSGLSFHNRYPYSAKIYCEEHGTKRKRDSRRSGSARFTAATEGGLARHLRFAAVTWI